MILGALHLPISQTQFLSFGLFKLLFLGKVVWVVGVIFVTELKRTSSEFYLQMNLSCLLKCSKIYVATQFAEVNN